MPFGISLPIPRLPIDLGLPVDTMTLLTAAVLVLASYWGILFVRTRDAERATERFIESVVGTVLGMIMVVLTAFVTAFDLLASEAPEIILGVVGLWGLINSVSVEIYLFTMVLTWIVLEAVGY